MFRSTTGRGPRPEPATGGPRPQAGFTLLEVLVAFGILALLIGLLFQAFSGGLRAAGSAERRVTAVLLAKSRLAQLEAAGDLAPGERGGELPGGYRWRAEIAAYRDDALGDPARLPLIPYRVELTVAWDPGPGAAASVSLTTLMLGPQP